MQRWQRVAASIHQTIAHSCLNLSTLLPCVAPPPPQRRGAHVPTEDEEFPPYFDTFAVREGCLLL